MNSLPNFGVGFPQIGNPLALQIAGNSRQNPEDMFTAQQNYDRNQAWAAPGPYATKLSPEQELQFRQWVSRNQIRFDPHSAEPQDYDMRGFWQAMQEGDPIAKDAVDPNDKKIHFPDKWKTPYAATFSNESKWAKPNAPRWNGDRYMLPDGHVIYDDAAGRWYGLPQ